MKKNIGKSSLFITLLVIMVVISSVIFMPRNNKKAYGVDFITSSAIYSEPKNTIDAIALGDSLVYSSISPMKIYEDYGYTLYDASTPAQKLNESYEFLSRIYETQSPRYVFLETEELFKDLSWSKDLSSRVEYQVPLLRYHNRWKHLKLKDLQKTMKYTHTDYMKGFRYYPQVTPAKKFKKPSNQITTTNLNYLKKIMALTKAHHTKLIMIYLPCLKTWSIKRHNTLTKLFKKHYQFIDFNMIPTLNINWDEDSRDGGDHLNYHGAMKVTDYFGQYLHKHTDLKSHAADPLYDSYELSLLLYKRKVKETRAQVPNHIKRT